MRSSTFQTIARLAQDKSEANTFSGIIHLQQGDDVLWQQAYGYANRAWHIPNTPDTRFRTASIGKMFTAVVILQLVDEGHLRPDSRLFDFITLPDSTFPVDITIHELLTMTAGIPDWFEESEDWEALWEALRRQTPLYLLRDNKDYLPLFAHKPLPGTRGQYQYSNTSYILLGLVLEQITGLAYPEVIKKKVFAAASMSHSGFWGLDEVVAGVAEGYIPQTDSTGLVTGWLRNVYETTPNAAADGGAVSTVGDLIRFAQALRQGQLLSPTLTQTILTPHVLENSDRFRGYDWYYGYGHEFLLDDRQQIVRYGHTGEEAGVSGRVYYYPVLDLDVVILGNQSFCAGSLGWAIHDAILAADG